MTGNELVITGDTVGTEVEIHVLKLAGTPVLDTTTVPATTLGCTCRSVLA